MWAPSLVPSQEDPTCHRTTEVHEPQLLSMCSRAWELPAPSRRATVTEAGALQPVPLSKTAAQPETANRTWGAAPARHHRRRAQPPQTEARAAQRQSVITTASKSVCLNWITPINHPLAHEANESPFYIINFQHFKYSSFCSVLVKLCSFLSYIHKMFYAMYDRINSFI